MFAQVLGHLEQISEQLDPGVLDGEHAAALLGDAARAERLCTAIKARLARRVEETKVWREGGHRSAAHWVAEATGATVGAAARTLETARALYQLPATDAAFRARTAVRPASSGDHFDGDRRSARRSRPPRRARRA